MLNYIKAELYKICRRKYTWIFLSVVLVLVAIFIFVWVGPFRFSDMVALLSSTMMFGSFLAVIIVDIVLSDPFRSGTLKNEVSFGISHTTIYLGKHFAAMILAFAVCGVIFAYYLGGTWLFTSHENIEAIKTNLLILGYVVAASVPLWLGTLGFAMACCFLLKNQVAGMVVIFLFLTVGGFIFSLFTMVQVESVNAVAGFLLEIHPIACFTAFEGALTWPLMAKSWSIGMGWLIVSTVVGLTSFHRAEIK